MDLRYCKKRLKLSSINYDGVSMQEIGESGGQAHLEKLDAIRSLPRSLNHKYYWSHTRMKWYLNITEVIYTIHVIE